MIGKIITKPGILIKELLTDEYEIWVKYSRKGKGKRTGISVYPFVKKALLSKIPNARNNTNQIASKNKTPFIPHFTQEDFMLK